jgi:hypothetical protein
MNTEVWYQGKAFLPNAEQQELIAEFHGPTADKDASAWFSKMKWDYGAGYADAVYIWRIEGEAREMVLSYADTYPWHDEGPQWDEREQDYLYD